VRGAAPLAVAAFLALFLPVAADGQEAAAPASCVTCHGSLQGELREPAVQWKGSVHSRNGIGCDACHGGDPSVQGTEAMSPKKGFRGAPGEVDIPAFCGRCHPGVEEDYRASAHGQALGSGGPQCVTCHGAHAVVKASPDLINRDRCTQCHDYGRADEIKTALARTDARISREDERIRAFQRVGYDTKDLENRLFQVRNAFHRLFHTFDVEQIRSRTEAFQEPLAELEGRLARLERIQDRRRVIGAVVVGALAFLTGLLALLRWSYRREEHRGR
jgi:nitrate/TMAO reductase-like tetraheme cytochrome c subunit